ncbi:MAG: GuaB1 family IMP dehydrogenase-related protein [Candidatus Gracilibacteria bacterium]|nr:GuaB1 family IMP dehydrogenase-related protein [Candidatus Gracilibacteria bacterium]MDD2908229.1 GuaB1 family IMP dehydrogenase-related protein [Candidatus Gracilibacteria bacterium]
MKFNNPLYEEEELAYEDVFLYQKYFEGTSRFGDINIKPELDFGTSIPIVSANMNAVTGKRMSEALARIGGLGILPQDMDIETMTRIIKEIKNSSIKFDTPITVKLNNTVRDALGIIFKRSHHAVILVDDENRPINIFTPKNFNDVDQYTQLGNLKKSFLITGNEDITDEEAFDIMDKKGISSLPIINKTGVLLGILTKKQTVRNSIYSQTLDNNGKLDLGVALGVNNFLEKAKALVELGINVFVLDTAHGYQKKMIEAIKLFRKELGSGPILIAGNVITAEGTRDIINAGANGVKVGVGPGAMCTTRMKTGVGRPQFSAVYKCSIEAKKLGGFVWADGGIKNPRDLVLALAAGANHVMIGTLFTGTYESTGDIKFDENLRMYKENYGMASRKAVGLRNADLSNFEQAKKALFKEGISTSKIYIKEGREGVGDIVDEFITGLRSAMTYVGAYDLPNFHEKALIGVQTHAGFFEGTPHGGVK